MEAYCWPGNVRELRNALSHAKQTMTSATISEFDLPEYVCSQACASCQFAPAVTQPPQKAQTLLMDSERAAILEALRASGDNLSRAAVMLGVSRVTLYRKLKKHQIRSDYS